ncbi:MAG TPA: TonB-dependent receptor [Terriglobales bacterium]|nr:TonB-dependent receptor [Terriglobales bacterium]
MCARPVLWWLFSALLLAFFVTPALPQSLTSGDITGIITDQTGAALPGATVILKNDETGATQTLTTNGEGVYRFSLLNPATYTISAKAKGFQSGTRTIQVSIGQASTANIQLGLAAASSQTVEVTAEGGAVQTQNGNVATTFTATQIANIPNPGNDLTYYVQTAPGATMNTQAGYGNSSTFGISATSNLFTIDGMNENDPFLNLSNSGATNLFLGTNDIQTATVVNNGYTGEYGELAGANVNFVTKSGTNNFHGNAEYFWNGRVLNANDWFNNNTVPVTPRSFDNANQWAASVGGPIIKNKTFFFVDTEGLRLFIPTSQPVNVPSSAFEAATLANLSSNGNAAEIPFYNKIFSIYNNAPGANRASDVGLGCGSATTIPLSTCILQFRSNASNLTHEWLLTARVDQNIGSNDRAFVHFRTDHGLQASITDPLTPVLNAQSVQPSYEGQFQENHSSGNSVNQFILSGAWYSAVFAPPSLSAATTLMPYELFFADGSLQVPGSTFYGTWPQGRNVTQYQISDDYSLQKGNHTLKFGINFRRNDLTDYTPGGFNATIPTATFNSLDSFYAGTADTFEQAFATRPTQPLAIYALGLYGQDEWAVKPNLKLTLSLRAEHNSNPICQTNCFARLDSSFFNMSHDPTQPYNQAILTGLHQALPSMEAVSWEPRLGFAWQPFGGMRTVVRGGIGIFADVFPGTIATSFDTNSPLKNTFITSGNLLAPGLPGSSQTVATAANAAFLAGFSAGQNIGQIETADPLFTPPAIVNAANNIRDPKYQEWNLEIQQGIGSKTSVSINYVGNHGSDLALENGGINTFCNGPATPLPYNPGLTGAASCQSSLGISGFVGLPLVPIDQRFSSVAEVGNNGVSNYNGVTFEFTRRFASLQVQANYTYSHALDDISNGGFLPFNFDTNTSILSPQDPFNFRFYNYGNADYDVRHQFTANYVYTTPRVHGLLGDLLNWTISGDFFVHTGLPFTAIDGGSTGALGSYNYGPLTGLSLFADSSVGTISCGSSATTVPCPTTSQFASPIGPGGIGSYGNQRRNQIYGPGFFSTDLTLMKDFNVPHWESAKFEVGAQAFNILNHPNFDQPVNDVSNSQFGTILRTVGPPTSIFGSFLGGDSSPRALQIKGLLTF